MKYKHDLFLSFNSAQRKWVRILASDLEQKHCIKCFFDEWDVRPGDNIRVSLRKGLTSSRRVALVISPESLASGWVELETSIASLNDPSNRSRRIIPIYRIDCTKVRIPEDLGIFCYIDFRDENCYEERLEDLAREVKSLSPIRRYCDEDHDLATNRLYHDISVTRTSNTTIEAFNLLKQTNEMREFQRAFELLISHYGESSIWTSRTRIRSSYHHFDGKFHSFFSHTYRLSLKCEISLQQGVNSKIAGVIRSGDDHFGRAVTGIETLRAHYREIEFSFPFYVELVPNSKTLVRFVIERFDSVCYEGSESIAPTEEPNDCTESEQVEIDLVRKKALSVFVLGDDGTARLIEIAGNEEAQSENEEPAKKNHKYFKSVLHKNRITVVFETDEGNEFGSCLIGKSL